jgi:SPP1 gp7 family putative phage head morphogenesis protein
VTTPQTDQQQQDDHTAEEAAVLAALVVFFASVAAVKATLLPVKLVARLVTLGLEPRAVRVAGRLALAPPLTGRGRYGSPARTTGPATTTLRTVKADEPLMRARYVLAAAKRLSRAARLNNRPDQGEQDTGKPKSRVDLFAAAVRQEKNYLDAHRQAGQNRAKAAAAYDRAAIDAGPNGKLRWTAVMDSRTTADCAALDGRLFTPDDPPNGLIPGAVHPRCRCTATVAYDSNAPVFTVS